MSYTPCSKCLAPAFGEGEKLVPPLCDECLGVTTQRRSIANDLVDEIMRAGAVKRVSAPKPQEGLTMEMLSPDTSSAPVEQTDTLKLRRRLVSGDFTFAPPTRGPEKEEFEKLPEQVRKDTRIALAAIKQIAEAKSKMAECRAQASTLRHLKGFSSPSLYRKYCDYLNSGGDWHAAMNAAKAGPEHWDTKTKDGMPAEFIVFWRELYVANKRKAAPAHRTLMRIWQTGVWPSGPKRGQPCPVPGYGTWQEWFARKHPGKPLPFGAPTPKGWHYRNLKRPQYSPPKAQEKLAREGIAAARVHTPHVLGTREGLRFLEEVQFDDVKTDWRVIDPATGQIMDLWLLIAIDRATGMVLGFNMRPARTREDATQEHLRLSDMKQLAGWVLERWGLPPYAILWKVENGTATLSEGVAAAVKDLLDGRLTVSYVRMIGGKSSVGYKERAVGNSRGKATTESTINLLHNEGGDIQGQTGPRYDKRPADLQAREKEVFQTWEMAQQLRPELRGQAKYPLLDLIQARAELNRIFGQMNHRTEHEIEGFDFIWEWRPSPQDQWEPLNTAPDVMPPLHETRRRKESPYQRMTALTRGLAWNQVSPLALVAFYECSQRKVTVDTKGEIKFCHEGKDYVFRAPDAAQALPEGTKLLAYHHSRELDLIHLTRLAPHSGYVTTWVKRARIAAHDHEGLAREIEYCQAAMKAHQMAVADHAQDARAELDAIREHNANLKANNDAIDADVVPTAPECAPQIGTVVGAVAVQLHQARAAVAQTVQEAKAAAKDEKALHAAAVAALKTEDNFTTEY